MTYTVKYHVPTTGVDFFRSNKDDFPWFLLKKVQPQNIEPQKKILSEILHF
jgi:hypothetical protein